MTRYSSLFIIIIWLYNYKYTVEPLNRLFVSKGRHVGHTVTMKPCNFDQQIFVWFNILSHTMCIKFRKNPRLVANFRVDLTWNDRLLHNKAIAKSIFI